MSTQYIVWIKCRYDDDGSKIENPIWEQQGDGPMGPKTAERVAREIAHDFDCATKVLPVGREPIYKEEGRK